MFTIYKLTETEASRLEKITDWFPQQQSEIPSGSRLQSVCDTTAITPSVLVHRLKCAEFVKCASELTSLKCAINETLDSTGNPLLVIDGLPATRENAATMITVLSLLGKSDLLEFKDFGTLIDDIRDKGIGGNRPASGNDLHFGLHTDLSFYSVPPSFVNFLMVCPSKEGGESLFCDIREVVKELSLETTERLKSDFLFPPPPRFPNLQPLNAPILTCNGDTFERVRYRHDGLRASNETQEKALCEFERKIWEHTVSLQLGAGQMAFFNNQLLLHGRAEFKDSENENEKRYAVRTYVRPVPPLNLIS